MWRAYSIGPLVLPEPCILQSIKMLLSRAHRKNVANGLQTHVNNRQQAGHRPAPEESATAVNASGSPFAIGNAPYAPQHQAPIPEHGAVRTTSPQSVNRYAPGANGSWLSEDRTVGANQPGASLPTRRQWPTESTAAFALQSTESPHGTLPAPENPNGFSSDSRDTDIRNAARLREIIFGKQEPTDLSSAMHDFDRYPGSEGNATPAAELSDIFSVNVEPNTRTLAQAKSRSFYDHNETQETEECYVSAEEKYLLDIGDEIIAKIKTLLPIGPANIIGHHQEAPVRTKFGYDAALTDAVATYFMDTSSTNEVLAYLDKIIADTENTPSSGIAGSSGPERRQAASEMRREVVDMNLTAGELRQFFYNDPTAIKILDGFAKFIYSEKPRHEALVATAVNSGNCDAMSYIAYTLARARLGPDCRVYLCGMIGDTSPDHTYCRIEKTDPHGNIISVIIDAWPKHSYAVLERHHFSYGKVHWDTNAGKPGVRGTPYKNRNKPKYDDFLKAVFQERESFFGNPVNHLGWPTLYNPLYPTAPDRPRARIKYRVHEETHDPTHSNKRPPDSDTGNALPSPLRKRPRASSKSDTESA